ncbi:MAG: BPSS1780 family membrane protein [Burkholderiaceae bacterium]|nr:BPSS1780 family membrane protein [Burkholderiaceae bacterium]
MSLRILNASARDGAAWVSRAFALFLKKPFAFSALFALFLFAALVFLVLPYIGAALLLMALPLLGLGFMIAARSAQGGGPVHAGQLFQALRGGDESALARRRQLLLLCGLYALATAGLMLASDMLDGGAFERLQVLLASARDASQQLELDKLLADGSLRQGLLLRLGGTALLSIPFWHAPALVWWQGQGLAQALFSSSVACWRNRAAFLVYGLAWTLTIVLFSAVAGTVFALIGAPQLVTLAAVPAGLIFSTAFYVSLLFTYEGCFGDSQDTEAPPGI